MLCTFVKAMPLGEGAVRRPGIDGTMDDSGFASQMGEPEPPEHEHPENFFRPVSGKARKWYTQTINPKP